MKNLLVSEVELNQHFLRVGDALLYVDNSWAERYIITEIHDSGILLKDSQGIESFYFFSELQPGWSISEKTKEHNRLYFKVKYLE